MEGSLHRLFRKRVRLSLFDWEGRKDRGGVKYSGERWGTGHKHMQEWACENLVKCWNTKTDSPRGSVAGVPLPYLSLFFRSKNIFRELKTRPVRRLGRQRCLSSSQTTWVLSQNPCGGHGSEDMDLWQFFHGPSPHTCAHTHTHPCTRNKLKLWSFRKRT